MPVRSKVRYAAYAILVFVGGGTLYIQTTDKTADNGAVCTLMGLLFLFVVELGYAIA